MRITELKKNISKLVELTSDKDFLEMIFSILDERAKDQNRDILADLTEDQMADLDESLEQIKKGEVVEHDVVMKEIRQKISDAKRRKWSKGARINYNNVVDYLISEWGEKVTDDFANKTETCIDVLRQHPYIGRKSEKREGIRKVLITKHNLLIYKVSNGIINILNIFDTRQDPKKSKY